MNPVSCWNPAASRAWHCVSAAWLTGLLAPAIVHAADQRSQGNEPRALEEVIVTAQKRSEHLQDVPISISVMNGVELARSNGANVNDAITSVPGMAMQRGVWGGLGELSVRGADARIDDVGFNSRAGCVVSVVSVERKVMLVDAVESPRRACLSGDEVDYAVLFDIVNTRIVCESGGSLFRHPH